MAARKKKSARRKTADAGKTAPRPAHPFLVCGIGCSAGGLSALEAFFRHVPADTGIAYVVVSHQKAGHISLLSQLLGKCTALPVSAVDGEVTVKPDHVYVSVPGEDLIMHDGRIATSPVHAGTGLHLPIDVFFRSLAKARRENAVGIILSGTGSDGTLGLKDIKGESGLVMAQSPDSAEYPGMPQSAMQHVEVDFVLPPEDMPKQLLDYVRGGQRPGAATAEEMGLSDAQIERILALLRSRTGRDFSEYKTSSVRRRLARRMNLHQMTSAEEYLQYLQYNSHEIDLLFQELLITVTQFFRDPEVWQALADKALPRLLPKLNDNEPFRAWVVGCATGEEAYSLAILLHDFFKAHDRHPQLQIFATDLDERSINIARAGLYSQGIAADVDAGRLERYFIPEDGHYRVHKEIRESVVFAVQDVTRDPPFMNLDLVSCRNLFIYMNNTLQERIVPMFHYILKPQGLLLLGPSESLGGNESLFTALNRKWRLYERRPATASTWLQTPPGPLPMRHRPDGDGGAPAAPAEIPQRFRNTHITRLAEQLFVKMFAPPSIIINERGDIYFLHGRTSPYLEPPTGQPHMNLFEMAREGLRLDLMTAVRTAATAEPHDKPVRHNARVIAEGRPLALTIEVVRLEDPEMLSGLFLVSFRPRETPTARPKGGRARPADKQAAEDPEKRIRELELELQHKGETLQTTVEELETANEELRASNEELQSTNEELQSTNEELETSREEMQSLNEELTTVNTELHAKVEELSRASDDMDNLLNSTGVATLFLDNDLRINRFNDQATELFKVIPTDVGRPISDLASDLDYEGLEADCRQVFKTLQPTEKNVRIKNGSWRQMRLTPYRTSSNLINGVVVTFADITDLKTNIRLSEEARSLAERIVQTISVPILILDGNLRVVADNRAFQEAFRVQPEAARGELVYEIGGGEWNIPELRRLLGEILEKNAAFQGYRVEHTFPRIGRHTMELSARALVEEAERPDLILLAIEEVTPAEK